MLYTLHPSTPILCQEAAFGFALWPCGLSPRGGAAGPVRHTARRTGLALCPARLQQSTLLQVLPGSYGVAVVTHDADSIN